MTRNPNAASRVRWPARRLVVEGESMVPTLEPGDRVVVVRSRLRDADLIALRDPRKPSRIMVKRISSIDATGRVLVTGDNPGASTDSRDFGPVHRSSVLGRVVYRYAPTARAGRLRRGARSPR